MSLAKLIRTYATKLHENKELLSYGNKSDESHQVIKWLRLSEQEQSREILCTSTMLILFVHLEIFCQ